MAQMQADVGIVVPLQEEFQALIEVFGAPEKLDNLTFDPFEAAPVGTFYRLPGPAGITVVAARSSDQGPEAAAISVERLLHRYSVRLICQIGIAGALGDDLMLGDVVVPKTIWAYHPRGKWSTDTSGEFVFEQGTLQHPASEKVLNPIRHLLDVSDPLYTCWRAGMAKQRPNLPADLQEGKHVRREPSAHEIDRLASGPFVIGTPKFWSKFYPTSSRLAAAVEMEAAGIGAALHGWEIPFLIVRGISDFADERKKNLDDQSGVWRWYAAYNAASFLHTVLPHCLPPRMVRASISASKAAVTAAQTALEPPPTSAGLLAELNSDDLLRVYRVAHSPQSHHELSGVLHWSGTGRITRAGARQLLGASPEWTADLVRDEFGKAPGGESATRVADLLSPPFADCVVDVVAPNLFSGNPAAQGNAMLALSRMGATAWAARILDAATADHDSLGELGDHAASALTLMFLSDAGAAPALEALLREWPDRAGNVQTMLGGSAPGEPQARVMQDWLRSEQPALMRAAAAGFAAAALAVGGQVDWARQELLARAASAGLRDDVAGALLAAVGEIGGPEAGQSLVGIQLPANRPRTVDGRDSGLARCVHLVPDTDRARTEVNRLLSRRTADLPQLAVRAAGLLGGAAFLPTVNGAITASDNPLHRGVAWLAATRLGSVDDARLGGRRTASDFEQVFIDLARLHLTGDSNLIPRISAILSRMRPLEGPFELDFRTVLREAGGAEGAELAGALEWVRINV